MLRITKRCNDAVYQFKWLRVLPEVCRPSKLQIGYFPDEYSYDMAIGETPSVNDVWSTLQQHVWSGKSSLEIARVEYVDYCTIAAGCGLWGAKLQTIFNELLTANLTFVTRCHGDATLNNAIREYSNGRIVLFDPGHARGLPCRELDESKLMQSMDGWGQVRYGEKPHDVWPRSWKIKRVHHVLLLTHYVRLLRHFHPTNALVFARRRIDELVEVLS